MTKLVCGSFLFCFNSSETIGSDFEPIQHNDANAAFLTSLFFWCINLVIPGIAFSASDRRYPKSNKASSCSSVFSESRYGKRSDEVTFLLLTRMYSMICLREFWEL